METTFRLRYRAGALRCEAERRKPDEWDVDLLECGDRAGTDALFMVSIWYPLTSKIGDMGWK